MYLDLNLLKQGKLFTKESWISVEGDKKCINSIGIKDNRIVTYHAVIEGEKTSVWTTNKDSFSDIELLDNSWFTIQDPLMFSKQQDTVEEPIWLKEYNKGLNIKPLQETWPQLPFRPYLANDCILPYATYTDNKQYSITSGVNYEKGTLISEGISVAPKLKSL